MYPKKSTEQFIYQANKTHNNKYDYSKVNYINTDIKVTIICQEHGEFEQVPYHHLSGRGCPKCYGNSKSNKEDFLKKVNIIHNNKYDYSKVDYINAYTKITIICPKHGDFNQRPTNHLSGNGCPICRTSKGELKIKKFLEDNNIEFIPQKTFDDCKGKKKCLPFDFFLPKYNLCIEYQGKQHYEVNKYWGGEENFKETQTTDIIKSDYCYLKGIELLQITYIDDIHKKLNSQFYLGV